MNKIVLNLVMKVLLTLLISQKKMFIKHIINSAIYSIKNLSNLHQKKHPKESWKKIVFWSIISAFISAVSKLLISKTNQLAHSE